MKKIFTCTMLEKKVDKPRTVARLMNEVQKETQSADMSVRMLAAMILFFLPILSDRKPEKKMPITWLS